MDTRDEIQKGLTRILCEMDAPITHILLFGSRARDEADDESDWDFLVVVKKGMTKEEKIVLWHVIHRDFHELFPFTSIDLVIKDEDEFESEKEVVNTISNEAFLEGIVV